VGKSALLANWALRRIAAERDAGTVRDSDTFTLIHLVAASPDGANWEKVARRIIAEFEDRFGLQSSDLVDLGAVRGRLDEVLHSVPANQRAILIIDGLNQFEGRDGALDLEQYAKLLPGDLVEDIAAAPQTGNPLFLRLMLEELRVYGDHLTLRRRLDELLGADAVPSLYKLILSRWEHDYDRDRPALVAESMVLLWASRRGLSESELRDLLGSGMQPLRHDLWSALYLAARQTLVNHDGIISFAHEYARSAVENRYLTDQLVQGAAHMRLAEYFLATYNRNLPPGFEELHRSGKVSEAARTLRAHRLFEELPWQVAHAGEWEKLAELFGGYWRDIERHIPGAALRAFASVIASPGRDFDMSWHVAVLLEHLGYRRECAEIFRQLDADGSGSMSASDRAGIAVNLASAALKAGNPHVALTMDAAVAQTYSSGADGYAAAALRNKAAALFKADQHREALRALDEAETIYRRLDDPVGVASCLTVRAPILDMLGEHDAASAAFEQQQRIYRESEDLDSLAVALSNHANMLSRQGDSAAAEALLIDALAVAQRLGDDRRRARVYEVRARTRLGRDWPGCLADLDECERLARAMGERATEASAIYMRALVKFVFHEWESAESLATRAARIRRELNDERGVAQCTELAGRAIEQRVAEFRHTNSPRGS
jgi:tetratricopeptide (TPR) repeat protein